MAEMSCGICLESHSPITVNDAGLLIIASVFNTALTVIGEWLFISSFL
jgi:hypothetical protein